MDEDAVIIRERAQHLARSTRKLMRDLAKMRKDHDLSQNEVAARMDMSQAAVSQLERHDANPTLNTVQRYALAVGARIDFEVVDDTSPALGAVSTEEKPIEVHIAESPRKRPSPFVWPSLSALPVEYSSKSNCLGV